MWAQSQSIPISCIAVFLVLSLFNVLTSVQRLGAFFHRAEVSAEREYSKSFQQKKLLRKTLNNMRSIYLG